MSKTITDFNNINAFENLNKFLKKINEDNNIFFLTKELIQNYNAISDPLLILEECENHFMKDL